MFSTSDSDGAPAVSMAVGTSGASAVALDQRSSPRAPSNLSMKLTGLGRPTVLVCTTKDISEGGLYVRVPVKAGLTVGQRCEVTFSKEAASQGAPGLAGEQCYATVVRTERLAGAPPHEVGAGLRFDRPIFL